MFLGVPAFDLKGQVGEGCEAATSVWLPQASGSMLLCEPLGSGMAVPP